MTAAASRPALQLLHVAIEGLPFPRQVAVVVIEREQDQDWLGLSQFDRRLHHDTSIGLDVELPRFVNPRQMSDDCWGPSPDDVTLILQIRREQEAAWYEEWQKRWDERQKRRRLT